VSGADEVRAAVLGLFAAIAVMGVVLAVLSRLGLLDHDGWVLRHQRHATPVAEPRRVPTGAYRAAPLDEFVARAHHDAVAAAACPLTYLPVSPDRRRKES
jgi:hypothetical protein